MLAIINQSASKLYNYPAMPARNKQRKDVYGHIKQQQMLLLNKAAVQIRA